MSKIYLGHLPHCDPLYGYLQKEIFNRFYGTAETVEFRVFRMNASNDVYLYEDTRTDRRVLGKFFLSSHMPDKNIASHRLEREYRNLREFRALGFDHGLHYVARPLGRNHELNRLLVVEYCQGESLDSVIGTAISTRHGNELFQRLTSLAFFLASLHNRTAQGGYVDFHECRQYTDSVLRDLQHQTLIGENEYREISSLCDQWRNCASMWQDNPVLVHGDATPSNFLFGDGLHVMSFDLERVRRTDRVFDVGRLAGELLHFFLRGTGNKYDAEPFIGHFLWEYACHFPDREQAFHSINRRIPYYMGSNLLRIARNDYLPWEYRRLLINETILSLRSIPK